MNCDHEPPILVSPFLFSCGTVAQLLLLNRQLDCLPIPSPQLVCCLWSFKFILSLFPSTPI